MYSYNFKLYYCINRIILLSHFLTREIESIRGINDTAKLPDEEQDRL